jgi:hypothetical protein
MSDLKDDEVIDPTRLKPRELLVQIHGTVTRLEKQNDERSKSDLETQLKIKALETKVEAQEKKKGNVFAFVIAAISSIMSAIATAIFTRS